MKISLTIGLLFLIAHSAFPPRVNPGSPHSKLNREFILSPYFYYSHYSKSPIGDPRNNTFSISRSPAEFDWGRYVGVGVIILCTSGLLGLILSGRHRAKTHSEQAGSSNGG
jgi:hypothetical protein